MYKAIMTHFIGPTNFKGSRYKADDGDGNTITLSADHSINISDNHRKAAEALRDKMGWKGELLQGATRNGYAFVFKDK